MAGVYGNNVLQLAGAASAKTGLSPVVEIAQWYAEEGSAALHTSTWGLFYNNPAGIRPGNPAADALSNGRTPAGFDSFPTPVAGAQAYADVMMQSNFASVRNAAATGRFSEGGKTYTGNAAELVALGASPWDAAHYEGTTGRVGGQLFNAYQSVTGSPLGVQAPSAASLYAPVSTKTVKGFFMALDQSMAMPSTQGLSVWNLPSFIFNGLQPLGIRFAFFLLGLIVILFGVLAFIGNNAGNVAKVANSIMPME